MKPYWKILVGIMMTIAVGCTPDYTPPTPYKYNTNPSFARCDARFYGAIFKNDSIKNNVFSVSLCTDSITMDSSHIVKGVGVALYIDNVFTTPSDSSLTDGIYLSSKNGDAFSFIPSYNLKIDGRYYTTTAYVYYSEKQTSNSTKKSIARGNFQISTAGTIQNISINVVTTDSSRISGHFSGKINLITQ